MTDQHADGFEYVENCARGADEPGTLEPGWDPSELLNDRIDLGPAPTADQRTEEPGDAG